MQTVASMLGRSPRFRAKKENLVLDDTLIGIEVEIDVDNEEDVTVFPAVGGSPWTAKSDGSLVRGAEFVLSRPLSGQDVVDAVYRLYEPPAKVNRTYTGSTHIHVDMSDDTDVEALRCLVLMAFSMENMLYGVGDPTRKWCGYANPLSSIAASEVEKLIKLDSNDTLRNVTSCIGRYYGLNLAALTKFGSVEFRYFPTAVNPRELLSWINLVLSFKKAAIELGNASAFVDILSSEDKYNEFITQYFSPWKEEANTYCPYISVKKLLYKANIMSSKETVKSAPRASYLEGIETGKYSKVFYHKKKGKKAKVATNSRGNIYAVLENELNSMVERTPSNSSSVESVSLDGTIPTGTMYINVTRHPTVNPSEWLSGAGPNDFAVRTYNGHLKVYLLGVWSSIEFIAENYNTLARIIHHHRSNIRVDFADLCTSGIITSQIYSNICDDLRILELILGEA